MNEQESRTLAEFSRHYGIEFRQPGLLKLALTHRSYLSVTGQGPRDSNERLEFLGDSVLGLVTSEFLYRQHPTEHEGQLTKTKSLLVSKAILSRRALAMGLGRFVLMSHSEIESGGRQRLSILADAFESVVGAIYLDQGFEAAREFILRWLLRDSREIVADKRHTNFKSHLQEYVQSTYRTHPVYRIRSEMGPDHSKQFNVDVMVGKRVLGSGRGANKKEAEQAAARHALEGVEAPRAERAARERPAAESVPVRTAGPATVEADASEESLAEAGRKRRGRRGGRGRSRRDEAIEESAPTPPAPAPPIEARPIEEPVARRRDAEEVAIVPPPPVRTRSIERIPPRAPVAETAAESHEPVEERFDEEDYEEVGRPEGPLEERHVDPFGIESPAEASPRSAPVPSSPEADLTPAREATSWRESDAAGESDVPLGREEREPAPEEPRRPEPAPQEERTRRDDPPTYGRRAGRGRR